MKGEEKGMNDDLTQINGIGAKTEERLNEADITTFAQLATSTPSELAAALQNMRGMSASRIENEEWILQAKQLAPDVTMEATPVEKSAASAPDAQDDVSAITLEEKRPVNRQHYATFKVDLLLEEDNEVRRTSVAHVQGGGQRKWAGWQPERLIGFMQEEADITHSQIVAQPADSPRAQPSSAAMTTGPSDGPEMMLSGKPHVREFEIVQKADSPRSVRRLVHHDHPFAILLDLDLDEVKSPQDTVLKYSVLLRAKHLGGGPRRTVGPVKGHVMDADRLVVRFPNVALQSGTYRLETEITLSAEEAGQLIASVPGDLLHVS